MQHRLVLSLGALLALRVGAGCELAANVDELEFSGGGGAGAGSSTSAAANGGNGGTMSTGGGAVESTSVSSVGGSGGSGSGGSGSGGSGSGGAGSTGTGGGGGGVVAGPSCDGLADDCGPADDESCCEVTVVPGGTFNRLNDANYPATVTSFALDRFEVTVARYRKFVEYVVTNAWKPAAGSGKHAHLDGGKGIANETGWDSAWDMTLPTTKAAWDTALICAGGEGPLSTWTPAPGSIEDRAINCIDWYQAYAFCIWDEGFLPSEAELNYAGAAGSEHRLYPWGSAAPDLTYATFNCEAGGTPGMCARNDNLTVGALSPKGDGKWGQADLAGGYHELALDSFAATPPMPCTDCAQLPGDTIVVLRGGSYTSANPNSALAVTARLSFSVEIGAGAAGVRCARVP